MKNMAKTNSKNTLVVSKQEEPNPSSYGDLITKGFPFGPEKISASWNIFHGSVRRRILLVLDLQLSILDSRHGELF